MQVLDVWEDGVYYLEIEGPNDVTDMVFTALAASGFTGQEPRFRHFFRPLGF